MKRTNKMKSGFTLIELTISLIVIGLLIGLSMKAFGMIETAKATSSAKTLEKMETSINLRNNDVNTFVSDLSESSTPDDDMWTALITDGKYLKDNDKTFQINNKTLTYSTSKSDDSNVYLEIDCGDTKPDWYDKFDKKNDDGDADNGDYTYVSADSKCYFKVY